MRQTWLSRRAIVLHAVIIIIVPTFAALCFWQVRRVMAGNQLSWAYVFEWPFFAGYAIYMWWRFLHEIPPGIAKPNDEALATHTSGMTSPPNGTAVTASAAEPRRDADADADAEERAAYNDYLSELSARGRRKQWR